MKLTPENVGLEKIVEKGDVTALLHVLRTGSDPNSCSADGEPALVLAASAGNLSVVRELLKAGSHVDATDELGNSALISCARDADLAIVKLLVANGADVNRRAKNGDTPLTNAACWGSAATVKYLLDHSAAPELVDGERVTAAQLARQHGHPRIAAPLERRVARAR